MKKKVLLCVALAVSLALLWLVQALLVPKYMGDNKEGAMIAEYYENAGNNDVVFIGDCEVYEGTLEVVGCSAFLWLHGCTHPSDPIKLYTEGLCTSLYANCR